MEYHIHIIADGKTIHIDGLPAETGTTALSAPVKRGIEMIHSLIEARVRGLDCICIGGICFGGEQPVIAAFDIWVQTLEEGYFLPMGLAAKLFSENGIPYYHSPFLS